MDAFSLPNSLPKGVKPMMDQKTIFKTSCTKSTEKVTAESENSSKHRIFWDGLSKGDNIGENDTRFLAFQLPNNIWIYEWFSGTAPSKCIYDFIDYHLQESPELINKYQIVGYDDPTFMVQRNDTPIKEALKRSTELRKRERMAILIPP